MHGSIWRAAEWHFSLRKHQGREKPCCVHEKVAYLLPVVGNQFTTAAVEPCMALSAKEEKPWSVLRQLIWCKQPVWAARRKLLWPGSSGCAAAPWHQGLVTSAAHSHSQSVPKLSFAGYLAGQPATRMLDWGSSCCSLLAPSPFLYHHLGNTICGSEMFCLLFGVKTILENVI